MTPAARAKRERLLAPSMVMRETQRRPGGGRDRAALVEKARVSIVKGSKSFASASKLFDRNTREKAWLLYFWCRRCDDIADDQDHGSAMQCRYASRAKTGSRRSRC